MAAPADLPEELEAASPLGAVGQGAGSRLRRRPRARGRSPVRADGREVALSVGKIEDARGNAQRGARDRGGLARAQLQKEARAKHLEHTAAAQRGFIRCGSAQPARNWKRVSQARERLEEVPVERSVPSVPL